MSRLSKKALLVFVVVTLAGAVLHFVYDLLPNPFTALFSPVNESLWEHIKILFWPGLAAAFLLSRGEERAALASRLLALLCACAAMLAVGYLYHIVLGGDALAFDLCLYVLMMACGFLIPCAFQKPFGDGARDLIFLLTIATGCAIFIFTFLPPALLLFTDLSGANTWVKLPC